MRALLTGLAALLVTGTLLVVGATDAQGVDAGDAPNRASLAAIDTLQSPFA